MCSEGIHVLVCIHNHEFTGVRMEKFTNMILYTVVLLTFIFHGESFASPCCSEATNDVCRNSCSQLVKPDIKQNENKLAQLKNLVLLGEFCSPQQTAFWRCINKTVPVVQSMMVWSAQPCCEKAVNRYCQEACYQATSVRELVRNCSQSTETKLYKCIEKHGDAEHCCRSANSYNCHLICRGTHMVSGLGRQKQRHIIRRQCHGVNQPIMQCVQNRHRPVRESDPELSLPCCYEAPADSECRNTCIEGIRLRYPENVFMEQLVKSCGVPKIHSDPLWACFLLNTNMEDDVDMERNIIDGARLQCCSKANTLACRNLCSRTFSTDWANTWDDFNTKCQSLAAPVLDVIMEGPMLSCMAEVEEPCQLGCDGLNFCSNFNSRPTELFRSCNAQTDIAARESLNSWQNGTIRLPQMSIPVKDIRECEPEMWKALVCALQIKPCNRRATPLPLCREDCFHILNQCVDHSRMKPGHTLQLLCNTLSPGDSKNGDCISVKKYLTESPHKHYGHVITSPCNPNPCEDNQVCWINRRKCRHPEVCLPYVCHNACGMGAVTNMYVPKNTYVRIPDAEKDFHGNAQCMHYRVCQCRHHNNLDNCKRLPCIQRDPCSTSKGHKKHGEHFKMDCNHCICHSGKVLCSQHRCPPEPGSEGLTGLPCDCVPNFAPQCGINGKTYPNRCMATKCAKLRSHELISGTCSSIDPCADNPCGDEYRCMPKRSVCLSNTMESSCNQYECVAVMGIDQCERHDHEPVCDTDNDEYTNICLLLAKKKRLAYRGHCQKYCSENGVVCGHNGESYNSECAALADRTTVDYMGQCRAVGMYSGNLTTSNNCANVACRAARPNHCRPITPPGGCCPVCAAEIRIMYSKELMNVAASAMNSAVITLADILLILSRQLSVVQCDLYGYLSVENDIVVLVAPVSAHPNMLLVHACSKEAERLGYLIQSDSPLMKSYLTLSPLLVASIHTPGVAIVQSAATSLSTPSLVVNTGLLLYTLYTWLYSV
ncbi:reversion-inducing cysteine-rich protein with Kazal motifs-like [Pecten maximus]|uniref:reversion-inducing cysteine-rich protein with Kazal motifs-like n=1 Tax=Pecten maximus TaxID=6579 RepID=UPI00145811DB|nr:reversion-inducing cysteine-rich protein with Kazal motifs-like [Pecten maximus]